MKWTLIRKAIKSVLLTVTLLPAFGTFEILHCQLLFWVLWTVNKLLWITWIVESCCIILFILGLCLSATFVGSIAVEIERFNLKALNRCLRGYQFFFFLLNGEVVKHHLIFWSKRKSRRSRTPKLNAQMACVFGHSAKGYWPFFDGDDN